MGEITKKMDLADFYDAEITVHDHLNEKRYIDHELIGTGTFKEVYKVFDTHCSREVAYSVLKKDVLSPENAVDFIREVQTTSGFEHPNIIRIYDVGLTDDRPWFTMELSSGRTLTELVNSEQYLELSEVLELFIQLCDAVHYAHQFEVIHLDLKPSNVNIDKHGKILLADWGIASSVCKLPEADLMRDSSQSHYIKGSLGYMAPEQADPSFNKSIATDLFSLGGILFFLLTKEAPIPASDEQQMLENTKAGMIKDLERPDIPPRLVPLLTKALAKDPKDRYETAAALQSEIKAFRKGFATDAESASVWVQLKLFFQRNKALSVTFLVALVLLTFSTGYYIFSIKESEANAKHSRQIAEKQKLEAEDQTTIAQYALKQAVEAEQAKVQTNQTFSNFLFKYAAGQMSEFDFKAALASAKSAVDRDPENKQALRRMGVIYFIRQEFSQAHHYLQLSKDLGFNDLLMLAEPHKEKVRPLPIEDLIQIFEQVPKRNFLLLCMVKFDASLRSAKFHSSLVEYLLKKLLNKPDLKFTYYPKAKTLDLTGNPSLRGVYSKKLPQTDSVNLLSSLALKRLILDDTPQNRENAKLRFQPNSKCRVLFR